MSLYDALGVAPAATPAELRRAYVELAQRYHPDHHVQSDDQTRQQADLRMREINDAWAVLGDPDRRRGYDRLRELRAAADRINARETARGRSSSRPRTAAMSGRSARPKDGATASASHSDASTLSERPRDWRSYASPGPAMDRPLGERLVLLLPVGLLCSSMLLGGLGAILRARIFAAFAVIAVGLAAIAFVLVPLLAMTEGARAQRRRAATRSARRR